MTIKFDGIARGASYYFNVNWSPGGSHYLGVSRYGSSVLLSRVIFQKCFQTWNSDELQWGLDAHKTDLGSTTMDVFRLTL